jgi:hypothetical protein
MFAGCGSAFGLFERTFDCADAGTEDEWEAHANRDRLGALGALRATLVLLFRPFDAQAVQPTVTVAPGNYVGVATCGGTTCHGRSLGDGPHVRQDEIMLWQDPATPAGAHSRAYAVLREPRSRAIAERLGIGEATGAPMSWLPRHPADGAA